MKIHRLLYLLVLGGGLLGALEGEGGIYRLEREELAHGTFLEGNVPFYWERLIQEPPREGPTLLLPVDRPWTRAVDPGTGVPFPPDGYATYRFHLILPQYPPEEPLAIRLQNITSAHRLVLGGKTILEEGRISPDAAHHVPSIRTRVVTFWPPSGEFDLWLQVQNVEDRLGGLQNPPYLGYASAVRAFHERKLMLDLFVFGSILIIAVYHLILFFTRSKEKEYLFFGLFASSLALRAGLTETRFLHDLLSFLPCPLLIRAEILSVYAAAVSLFLYFHRLFPHEELRPLSNAHYTVTGAFILMGVFLPFRLFTEVHIYYEYYLIASCLVLLAWLVRALVHRREQALLFTMGMLVLTVTVVNDVLFSIYQRGSGYLSQYGLIVFLLVQALILARKYAHVHRAMREASWKAETMATLYSRFVPFTMLRLLGKEGVEGLRGGEHTTCELSVMVCSLMPLVSLSEKIAPHQTSAFLSSYARQIIPVVKNHGGIFESFLGEKMTFLFPGEPEEAVQSIFALFRFLREYNAGRAAAGYEPAGLSIGASHGRALLAVVSAGERLAYTGIGEVFSLAAEVEGLTRVFGAAALITDQLFPALARVEESSYRFLGRLRTPQRVIPLFEIIDPEDAVKRSTASMFERALYAYCLGELDEAEKGFLEVLSHAPEDKAAAFYLKRIQIHSKEGTQRLESGHPEIL